MCPNCLLYILAPKKESIVLNGMLLLEVYMLLLSFAPGWIKLVCILLSMLLIVSFIRHRMLF